MSTMVRLHTMRGLTEADYQCFCNWQSRRRCTEPRRPGSFFDSEVMNRIIAERDDGKDPRPCGHQAAVEEGDKIEIGEDTWEPTAAVADLFDWSYGRSVLTNELVYEIVKAGQMRGSGPYNDRKVINWLSRHVGDEVFCVHW
jgi:hypothetical protein